MRWGKVKLYFLSLSINKIEILIEYSHLVTKRLMSLCGSTEFAAKGGPVVQTYHPLEGNVT